MTSILRVDEQAKHPCRLFSVDFLLGLFFGPESESDMFLRNIGGILPNYNALQPTISHSS
jgi:hypothetical protein